MSWLFSSKATNTNSSGSFDPFGNESVTTLQIVLGRAVRSILVLFIVTFVMVLPLYNLGKFGADIWDTFPSNANHFSKKDIVHPKVVEIKNPTLSQTNSAPLINGQNYLYISINNQVNPEVGFYPFVYKMLIYNASGTIIFQKDYSNYLLPGKTKYIVSPPMTEDASTMSVVVDDQATVPINVNPNGDKVYREPKIDIRNKDVEPIKGTSNLLITASFKNEDKIRIKEMNVLYLVRDLRERVVGIGETTLKNFGPDATQDLSLEYPAPKDRDATIADMQWSVNYLDENNLTLEI